MDVAAWRLAVVAAVQHWAVFLASARGMDMSDPRTREWIESFIRYRLRQGLPAISDRGAIPGAIGVAETGEDETLYGVIQINGLYAVIDCVFGGPYVSADTAVDEGYPAASDGAYVSL